MPNTGLAIPANPAPAVNNTRQDEKPETKTMRESASVRQKLNKQSEAKQRKKMLKWRSALASKNGKWNMPTCTLRT